MKGQIDGEQKEKGQELDKPGYLGSYSGVKTAEEHHHT